MAYTTSSPAHRWEDGLVVGTGSTGALLWGTPHAATVELAHEEFFLPVNSRALPPRTSAVLPETRAALDSGRFAEAAELLAQAAADAGYTGLVWTDPFVPVGTVTIEWGRDDETASERTLDLEHSAASWTQGGATVAIEADRLADAVAIRVSGVSGPLRVRLGATRSTDVSESLTVVDYRDAVRVEPSVTPESLVLAVAAHQPTSQRTAQTSLGFSPSPVRTWTDEDGAWAEFDATGPITITARVDVRADIPDSPPALQANPASQAELLGRCRLDLRGAEYDTTDELFDRARAGDGDARRAAVEFAFATGRANAIASTGTLPPNLLGVWQGTWSPEWSGDYTINGNVQNGSVAALVSSGTPELMLSLFRLIDRFRDDYRTNAFRLFGARGAYVPARVSTHALANHVIVSYPHVYWLGSAAWIARLAFDYFSATGDRRFVTEWALPFVREAVQFFDDVAVEINGCLHLAPTFSPENTPANASHPITSDATSEIQMVRDLLLVGSRFARLEGDDEAATRWLHQRDAYVDYRVSPSGQLSEWIDPRLEDQSAHRHSSHLYPLWYEGDERFDIPALRAAAAATISARMSYRAADTSAPPGHMEMAFGLEQLGVAAAELGDATTAMQCVEWLALLHWTPAGTSTHDAGSIFNMDSAGGLPALVIEMLVRTTPNSVTLLSALPDEWPSGRVEGVRGRGGLVIESLEWSPTGARAILSRAPGSDAAWPEATRINAGDGWTVTSSATMTAAEDRAVVTLERR